MPLCLTSQDEVSVHTIRDLFFDSVIASQVLLHLELAHGQRISICHKNGYDVFKWTQAAQRLGCPYVPLASSMSEESIFSRLSDVAPSIFLAPSVMFSSNLQCMLSEAISSLRFVSIDGKTSSDIIDAWTLFEELKRLTSTRVPVALWTMHQPFPVDTSFPLFILYTSGSTGKPKGVVHTHGGYIVAVRETGRIVMGLDEDQVDTIFVVGNPGWITGQSYMIAAPLLWNKQSIVMDGSIVTPVDRFARIIQNHGAKIFKAGSTYLRLLMSRGDSENLLKRFDLSSLRRGIFCAEPVHPTDHLFACTNIVSNYINCYWATEHGSMICGLPLSTRQDPDARTWLLKWTAARAVATDEGTWCQCVDEQAEFVLTSYCPSRVFAIWGDTKSFGSCTWRGNAERFATYYTRQADRWCFVQGDACTDHGDGSFSFHGRSDEVVNVGGIRLATADIEACLFEKRDTFCVDIRDWAAVGRRDDITGSRICVFAVATDASAQRQLRCRSEVQAAILTCLGKAAVPRDVVFVEELPYTHSGKIVRRILRALLEAQGVGDTSTLTNPMCVPRIRSHLNTIVSDSDTSGISSHPLLLYELDFSDNKIYRTPISASFCAYFEDHVIRGLVIFPAAAYLEAFGALGLQNNMILSFHDTIFATPMVLGTDKTNVFEVEVVSTTLTARTGILSMMRLAEMSEHSSTHTHGTSEEVLVPTASADVHSTATACEIYCEFTRRGFQYGPQYRRLSSPTNDRALLVSKLAPRPCEVFNLHPSTIDASIQLALTLSFSSGEEGRLPFAIGKTSMLKAALHSEMFVSASVDGFSCAVHDAHSYSTPLQIRSFRSRVFPRAKTPALESRFELSWATSTKQHVSWGHCIFLSRHSDLEPVRTTPEGLIVLHAERDEEEICVLRRALTLSCIGSARFVFLTLRNFSAANVSVVGASLWGLARSLRVQGSFVDCIDAQRALSSLATLPHLNNEAEIRCEHKDVRVLRIRRIAHSSRKQVTGLSSRHYFCGNSTLLSRWRERLRVFGQCQSLDMKNLMTLPLKSHLWVDVQSILTHNVCLDGTQMMWNMHCTAHKLCLASLYIISSTCSVIANEYTAPLTSAFYAAIDAFSRLRICQAQACLSYQTNLRILPAPSLSKLLDSFQRSVVEISISACTAVEQLYFDALFEFELTTNALQEEKEKRKRQVSREIDSSATKTFTMDTIRTLIENTIGPVDADAALMDSGLTSMSALELKNSLQNASRSTIPSTLAFDHPTLRSISSVLLASASTESNSGVTADPANRFSPFTSAEMPGAYKYGMNESLDLHVGHHMYFEFQFKTLDVYRFRRAWEMVFERHDALRTEVRDDGTSMVHPHLTPLVTILDLCACEECECAEQLLLARNTWIHADPSEIPYVKHKVLMLADCAYVLEYFSGLCMDAQSFSAVKREVQALYINEKSPLDPVPSFSFRDYVVAEHEIRSSQRGQDSLAWWSERVTSMPPSLALPTIRSFHQHRTSMDCKVWKVKKDVWANVLHIATLSKISASFLFYSIFAETWAMWSMGRHFCLSMLVSRRLPLHPDVSKIVGSFYSAFPLEVNFEEKAPFVERVNKMSEQMLDIFKHRWCAGIEVLGLLNRYYGGTTESPLPYVLSSGLANSRIEGVSAALMHSKNHTFLCYDTPQTLVDVIANTNEMNDVIFTYMFVSDVFENGLHDTILSQANLLVNKLTMNSSWDAERVVTIDARVVSGESDAEEPAGLLSDALLRRKAMKNPALVCSRQEHTTSEFYLLANTLAWKLRSLCRSGDCVAVILAKSMWCSIAAFGIQLACCAYVPIDVQLPVERKTCIINDADIHVAVVEQPIAVSAAIAFMRIDQLGDRISIPVKEVTTPEMAAYVIFTSGSTGKPKGVVLNHRGPLNTCCDVNQRFAVSSSDSIFAISSMSFDLSVYDIFGSVLAGATLVYPLSTDVHNPGAWIQTLKNITVWNSAPALMQLFLDTIDSDVSFPLRIALLSGDWIPLSMPNRIQEIASPRLQVCSLGGATEASIWSIWFEIQTSIPIPTSWTSIPYGYAMQNQCWFILDGHLHLLPFDAPGELYIGGIGLAIGYVDSQKTEERFIFHESIGKRLYKTGDIGRMRTEGWIEFLGRMDAQVKIGGYRVELGEIEHVLRCHPAVREAVVLAKGERTNRLLAAWVQLQTGSQTSGDELKKAASESLPAYMVPNVFSFLDVFPVTANGKLDRSRLHLEVVKSVTATETLGPREETMLHIWREFLENSSIGVNDNFFQRGGTSLRAMQLAVRLRREFSVDMSIADILSHPTVAQLSPLLEHATIEWSPLVTLRNMNSGIGYPVFCVHPSGGEVVAYRALLDVIRNPLFAFRASGLSQDTVDASVSAMASRYADALARACKKNKLSLLGWSFGGLVAFEMTSLLEQYGYKVDQVILVDTASPFKKQIVCDNIFKWFLDDMQLGIDTASLHINLSHPSHSLFLDALRNISQEHGVSMDAESLWPFFKVFEASIRASQDFTPRVSQTPIVLVRAITSVVEEYAEHPRGADDAWGWDSFASVTTSWFEGTHFSLLHSVEVLRFIADTIEPQHSEAVESGFTHAFSGGVNNITEVNEATLDSIAQIISDRVPIEIDVDLPLTSYGFDSANAIELRTHLQDLTVEHLPLLVFMEERTLRDFFVSYTPQTNNTQNTIVNVSVRMPSNQISLELLGFHRACNVDAIANCKQQSAFIDNAQLFDNAYFSVSRVEALHMDPQQRLLLEQSADVLRNSDVTGPDVAVCIGFENVDFMIDRVEERIPSTSVYAATGSAISIACGRISYALGLHGPCMSIAAACASSLVAVHVASNMNAQYAIASGVALVRGTTFRNWLATAGLLSTAGRCFTFDRRANGYARGEASCTALLGDGFHIRLMSSGAQQDGRSASLTAPNGKSQELLLRSVYEKTAVPRCSEAHGTGTALGDPIEAASLERALVANVPPLAFSGGKANNAHAESAAGISGCMQCISQFQTTNHTNAQLRIINPHVGNMTNTSKFSLATQATRNIGSVGGVSSFGYNGSIAHAVWGTSQRTSFYRTRSTLFRRRLISWTEKSYRFIGLSSGGLIDNIEMQRTGKKRLKRSEVRIQVKAVGLNFRDVLNILDADPTKTTRPLGLECAGIISQVGSRESALVVGDATFGYALGSLGEFAVTDVKLHVSKPARLDFEQASTLPILANSVLLAMQIARLKRGDEILVHSVSSGLGSVVIEWALTIGVRVHGTAGSKSKRNHARLAGCTTVGDSRNVVAFAKYFSQFGGKRFDAVFTALSNEMIPVSAATLGVHGLYLEFGKNNIWTPDRMLKTMERDAFRLVAADYQTKDWTHASLQTIVKRVEKGDLNPLVFTVFDFTTEAITRAFKTLRRGENVGRFVVSMNPINPARPDRGRLVKVLLHDQNVVIIELNDPLHFNTLSKQLGADMNHAVEYVSAMIGVRAIVVRGAGDHFSVGGNPYNSGDIASTDESVFACGLKDLYSGFVKLGKMNVPVICAVHGILVGGGIAACLHADYIVASSSTRFEHGNLVRGVCPLGMFSRTFGARVGYRTAMRIFLQNSKISAYEAHACNLVNEVHEDAKKRAVEIASRVAREDSLAQHMISNRTSWDDSTMREKESLLHARCQLKNGGMVRPLDITFDSFAWDGNIRKEVITSNHEGVGPTTNAARVVVFSQTTSLPLELSSSLVLVEYCTDEIYNWNLRSDYCIVSDKTFVQADGTYFSAKNAHARGLVSEVHEHPEARALEFAHWLMIHPDNGLRCTMQLMKSQIVTEPFRIPQITTRAPSCVKTNIGIHGVCFFSYPCTAEGQIRSDATSLALSALSMLMKSKDLHSQEIGMLQVATNMQMDRSKSIKSELMSLLEPCQDVEGVDHTGPHAGFNALQSCLTWSSLQHVSRWAILVAVDIQERGTKIFGGAIAMLVGSDAPIVPSEISYDTRSNVATFRKPCTAYPLKTIDAGNESHAFINYDGFANYVLSTDLSTRSEALNLHEYVPEPLLLGSVVMGLLKTRQNYVRLRSISSGRVLNLSINVRWFIDVDNKNSCGAVPKKACCDDSPSQHYETIEAQGFQRIFVGEGHPNGTEYRKYVNISNEERVLPYTAVEERQTEIVGTLPSQFLDSFADARKSLKKIVSEFVQDVDNDARLLDLGLDSLALTELKSRLEGAGYDVTPETTVNTCLARHEPAPSGISELIRTFLPSLTMDETLGDAGLDSLAATELKAQLQSRGFSVDNVSSLCLRDVNSVVRSQGDMDTTTHAPRSVQLRQIVHEFLPGIEDDSPFAENGLDSLAWRELLTRLAIVDDSDFEACASIRDIISTIQDDGTMTSSPASNPLLVPVATTKHCCFVLLRGEFLPSSYFVIHMPDGMTSLFSGWARAQTNVIGVESAVLHFGSRMLFHTLKEMAEAYLDDIVSTFVSIDTLKLVGASFGATLAYEIASIAHQRGVNVEHIVLVDPAPTMTWVTGTGDIQLRRLAAKTQIVRSCIVQGCPRDPEEVQKVFDQLESMDSIDFTYAETLVQIASMPDRLSTAVISKRRLDCWIMCFRMLSSYTFPQCKITNINVVLASKRHILFPDTESFEELNALFGIDCKILDGEHLDVLSTCALNPKFLDLFRKEICTH